MLQFMGDNKRLLHFHEQKLSDLEPFKSDTQVFQKNTSASLKNLETQVGKLALNMPNQSKGDSCHGRVSGINKICIS